MSRPIRNPTEMLKPADQALDKSAGISSKLIVIDRALAELAELLDRLDNAQLSMASIHINSAIETLRADRERLKMDVDR